MQAVSKIGPDGEGGGANFVAGNTFNSVQRSRYGKRVAQNMTRHVQLARNLVNSAGGCSLNIIDALTSYCPLVDPEIKRRIDIRIADARNALKDLEQQTTDLSKEDALIRAEEAEFKKKLVRVISQSISVFKLNY